MGVTRREQQMLNLSEQGLNDGEIAEEMGVKRSSVRRTLRLLRVDFSAERRDRAATAAASEQLKLSVQALGGHR